MNVIAYQLSPTGIYKLVIKVDKGDHRIVLVDDINGLGDILYDTEVKLIDEGKGTDLLDLYGIIDKF